MKIMRRFLAPLLALCFALTSAPVGAIPPALTAATLSGVQGWSFPGSSADLYFARNGGSCTINRLLKPCASLLTTTRASTGYAQWADGHLSRFAANFPRITDLGLLVEQAATNVVLWNRDLTNAAWTKSNITATLNQTGADGTANAATSLTATAGNGTCLQAITLASSARFQSAYVKRLTGTGTINMTMDNGATWTAITVTSAYTQLTIPTQTLANPTVGFRIVTSGDAIAVDLVGNETGTFATSPIATTTVAVTRAADSIVPAGTAANAFTPAAISIFVQSNNVASFSGFPRYIGYSNGHAPLQITNNTKTSAYNGSVELDATLGSGTVTGSTVKTAIGYDGIGRSIVANNGTVATDANVEALGANSVFIGAQSAGGQFLNGYIARLAVFGRRLSDAQLKALTQ